MQDNDRKARELSLEEMLADPIVWMVMKSDQVRRTQAKETAKAGCR